MGMRIENAINNAVSGVFDAMTEAKTKKAEKAFASYLDSIAKSGVNIQESASQPIDVSTDSSQASAQEDMSETQNSASKTETKDKVDKSDKTEKETVKDVDAASKDVSDEEEAVELVGEIEEAIKSIIAQQLGITVEEVDLKLQEMGINAVDLLEGNNLLEFTMQINGVDDMSAVLTDENLLEQYKTLTEEIDFAVKDVLEKHQLTKEQLPQLVETANVQAEEAVEVVVERTETKTTDTTQTVVVDEAETDNTVEAAKTSDFEKNNAFTNNEHTDGNNAMNLQTTNQTASSQVINNIANASANYTSVDMEAIVKQIVDQIKIQVSEQNTSMEMQLNPESYGKLQLQVAVKDGIVTAHMAVENEAVKSALEAQVVQLREQMNNQGVKVEAIEVTIASHEFERNLQQESNANQQAFEEAQSKATRQRMNLNLNMEDLQAEDIANMSEAEQLERKIMLESGNRMSIQA